MKKTGKKCIFAGTFDPPTLGHKATVEDSLKLLDEVVVAILVNPKKTPLFTVEQRTEMWRLMFPSEPRLRVVAFEGTAVELLKKENTPFYVRGIRNGSDLDFENANFYASKKLDSDFVAVYLPCRQEYLHISSSMVRNSLHFHTPIKDYVTEEVEEYIGRVQKHERGES